MFDVVIVGGGTAGCVLATRLSEDPSRSVCLVEAGPDYGPRDSGQWPADLLDAGAIAETHGWGPGGEDERTLGGRVLGGSSAVNACVAVRGIAADYDEWGPGWTYEELAPYLDRAEAMLRTAVANTQTPAPFHVAAIAAARALGASAAPFPANVVGPTRWNAVFAYLETARDRPNLDIVSDVLVDRVLLDGRRATAVVCADGRRFGAGTVVLAAGAYFSPAILMRSGIGPEAGLRQLGITIHETLPVGERLLDHYGTSVAWQPTARLDAETAAHVERHHLFEAHTLITAASSACVPGSFDIHILPWIYPAETPGRFHVSAPCFHMKPLSSGRLRLRSKDPAEAPCVERGFLSHEEDLTTIVEAIELAREIARTAPLTAHLEAELRPGRVDLAEYVRRSARSYFHPAGTCPIGAVVDPQCHVLGTEGLLVADASVMPTIPRANTNLTTAAIAERVAATF